MINAAKSTETVLDGDQFLMVRFRPAIAAAFFLPAIAGLAIQVATSQAWPERFLALAMLVLAPEQAYMAGVDLRQIMFVQRRKQDVRLKTLHRLVWATIAGQLVGFYLAATGWLGWGMLAILCSLMMFNSLAAIRLDPANQTPIIRFRWIDRLNVLGLNLLASCLGILWLLNTIQIWAAGGILAIVSAYVISKLLAYGRAWQQFDSASPTHAANTAE